MQAIEKKVLVKIPEGIFLLKEKFSWQNKNFVRMGAILGENKSPNNYSA